MVGDGVEPIDPILGILAQSLDELFNGILKAGGIHGYRNTGQEYRPASRFGHSNGLRDVTGVSERGSKALCVNKGDASGAALDTDRAATLSSIQNLS